ncbi:MAG: hypothetical protein ACQSGP_01655 [Frankia sp.]
MTIAAVFVLVALTSWKPAVFGFPSLGVIAALGILDYVVVMTRPEPRGRRGRRASLGPDGGSGHDDFDDDWLDGPDAGEPGGRQTRRAGRPAADEAWYAEEGYDPAAATAMMPRVVPDADGSYATPTAAIPRPAGRTPETADRRSKPLHPAYARQFTPDEDVLSWDDDDGSDSEDRREDAVVHTMAIDIRGLLNETGTYRI